MDSDSDHFESADENFDSDEEDREIDESKISSVSNKNEYIEPGVTNEVKNIKIQEAEYEINKKKEIETTIEKHETIVEKNEKQEIVEQIKTPPNESNIEDELVKQINSQIKQKNIRSKNADKKERPQKMKSKLGVKLGTKIEKNANFDSSETGDVKVETKTSSDLGWDDEWATIEDTSDSSQLYSQKSEQSEKNYWKNEEDYMEIPKIENSNTIADKLSAGDQPEANSSWSSWGNWKVSSLLSTASLGVSTLTNSVSQGISTVLETGIGIPDPEELARIDKSEKSKRNANSSIENEKEQINKNNEKTTSTLGLGLGNLVSGVTHITKLVETTGTKVLSGGLDTLEVIGKKTIEVLQEGDPGFKKKKAFLGLENEKPILSHVLREAKEKAEEENKLLEERHFAKKAHYETLFDDHQGLVHLEALEMLSKQCDIKLETLQESYTGNELTEFQETMAQIKELCEIPDEDEDQDTNDYETVKEKLETAIEELNVAITYDNLLKTWNQVDEWLEDIHDSEKEIHQYAIETLAKMTAICVEQYHKAGELLLIKERRSTVDEADSLVQLTTTLTSLIGMVAGKFSEKLNALAEFSNQPDSVNSLITNIFFEAANSSSYIQDAFQLLIPVLQAGAV